MARKIPMFPRRGMVMDATGRHIVIARAFIDERKLTTEKVWRQGRLPQGDAAMWRYFDLKSENMDMLRLKVEEMSSATVASIVAFSFDVDFSVVHHGHSWLFDTGVTGWEIMQETAVMVLAATIAHELRPQPARDNVRRLRSVGA